MQFFLFFIFFFFVIIALSLYLFAKRNPKTSDADEGGFKSSLPEGYGYPYDFDNTGYALNVKEKKILILSNGIHYIFGLEKIRGFSSRQEEASQFHGYLAAPGLITMGSGLAIMNYNAQKRKQAYENSGIFIKTSDIDAPVLQIKFGSESDMNRSLEILQQFIDGTLIDYDEYLEGIDGFSCATCRSKRTYIDATGEWYCPDCRKYVKISS